MPESASPELRERFRAYLDARLAMYATFADLEDVRAKLARSTALQNEIWNAALGVPRSGMPQATMLLLPALNPMIDVTTSRTMATRFHQPTVIFACCSRSRCSRRCWPATAWRAPQAALDAHDRLRAITAIAIYVIMDLEYPRLGFIRVDAADQALIELRASMN